MRSLPQPRYSKLRTWKRIWRSLIQSISISYVSDSSAFTKHKPQRRTKIRKSRISILRRSNYGGITARPKVSHSISSKILSSACSILDDNNDVLITKIDWVGGMWKYVRNKWFKMYDYPEMGNHGGHTVDRLISKKNIDFDLLI